MPAAIPHTRGVAKNRLEFWKRGWTLDGPGPGRHTMRQIENVVIGIALGAVPVIAGFLAGWWISIPLVPESLILLCALAGLGLGVSFEITSGMILGIIAGGGSAILVLNWWLAVRAVECAHKYFCALPALTPARNMTSPK